ncbi:MAG: hypothetical protein Q9179_006373 [Wetmoreana sp. 5 TL-2023]
MADTAVDDAFSKALQELETLVDVRGRLSNKERDKLDDIVDVKLDMLVAALRVYTTMETSSIFSSISD